MFIVQQVIQNDDEILCKHLSLRDNLKFDFRIIFFFLSNLDGIQNWDEKAFGFYQQFFFFIFLLVCLPEFQWSKHLWNGHNFFRIFSRCAPCFFLGYWASAHAAHSHFLSHTPPSFCCYSHSFPLWQEFWCRFSPPFILSHESISILHIFCLESFQLLIHTKPIFTASYIYWLAIEKKMWPTLIQRQNRRFTNSGANKQHE